MTNEKELIEIIYERYNDIADTYEKEGQLEALLNCPSQFLIVDKTLQYLLDNPDATLKEAFDYMNSILPDSPYPLNFSEENLKSFKKELLADDE